MGRTGRPNLRHYTISDSAPRGTAGRGPNWDRRPCAGHAGASRRCTKRHRRPWPNRDHGPRAACGSYGSTLHISAPPAAGPFGNRGPRAGRRSCVTRSGPTRLRMRISAPPIAGPARGPWATSGPEELRDPEQSPGCRRDAVPVCFQYPAPEFTVMVTWRSTFLPHDIVVVEEDSLVYPNLPMSCSPRVLTQTARKLVSPVTPQIVCESR